MLCLGLRCDGHTCPGLLNLIGGSGLMCRSVCGSNVGDGGLDMDGQDDVNIWELL